MAPYIRLIAPPGRHHAPHRAPSNHRPTHLALCKPSTRQPRPPTHYRISPTNLVAFHLEIERKFAPTATSMQQLASNTGTPPFKSPIHYGTTNLEDSYYDTVDEVLCNAGVWLRRRGNKWEAKVRVGGDLTNSTSEEITDVEDISTMLGKLVLGAAIDPREGLLCGRVKGVAQLVCRRNKFLADRKVTVVLDETDFGHVVGEVELQRDIPFAGGEDHANGAERKDQKKEQVVAEMDREIDNFMKRYVWAFPPGKPVGKLSAYFALKKQRQ
ncbi:hypothetical protein VMCG_10014 [Cytospora schulzeri]|uniref:Thiamine-triphosphatase n=1 Tax=Cytospora schulzeri TaxID=448051 RepID=A0A423VI09_9PEZI|nr:hypothetical protein VMCG_10014 [Valsa malicola]